MESALVEVEALLDKYRAYKLTGRADLFKTITPFERLAPELGHNVGA
jgi:hypothetical protein